MNEDLLRTEESQTTNTGREKTREVHGQFAAGLSSFLLNECNMKMKPSVIFLEAGAQEDKLEIIFLLWYVAQPQSLVFFPTDTSICQS